MKAIRNDDASLAILNTQLAADTAAASAVLAVAVNVPGFVQVMLILVAPVLVIAAVLHSANFATSEARPLLATFSWLLLSVFFALLVGFMTLVHSENAFASGEIVMPVLICVMALCGLVCVYRAYRSFLQIWRS